MSFVNKRKKRKERVSVCVCMKESVYVFECLWMNERKKRKEKREKEQRKRERDIDREWEKESDNVRIVFILLIKTSWNVRHSNHPHSSLSMNDVSLFLNHRSSSIENSFVFTTFQSNLKKIRLVFFCQGLSINDVMLDVPIRKMCQQFPKWDKCAKKNLT